MIAEDYCSFEVAKLLKEKGFPQEYDMYHSMVYNEKDYEDEYEVQRMVLETRLIKAGTLSSYPIGVPEPKCYCPTHQMAMKWLREVYNLFIVIDRHYFVVDKISHIASGFKYSIEIKTINTVYTYNDYRTHEQAVEAALKYCLGKLKLI